MTYGKEAGEDHLADEMYDALFIDKLRVMHLQRRK